MVDDGDMQCVQANFAPEDTLYMNLMPEGHTFACIRWLDDGSDSGVIEINHIKSLAKDIGRRLSCARVQKWKRADEKELWCLLPLRTLLPDGKTNYGSWSQHAIAACVGLFWKQSLMLNKCFRNQYDWTIARRIDIIL